MESAITCPNGFSGKQVVLLVHGTTSTGYGPFRCPADAVQRLTANLSIETWALGPYVNLLPDEGDGYDVCWIDLPDRSLSDAQRSGSYVA